MTSTAFISLGSNLGNRKETCQRALSTLTSYSEVSLMASSAYYESEAVTLSDKNQPHYINQVIKIKTSWSSEELLEKLQDIENQLGRVRLKKWGPRTLDLDILYYDDCVSETPHLTLPHPEIHNRPFILIPLKEIAPHFRDPKRNKTIQELCVNIPHPPNSVVKIP